jgi:hypothetical protein
MIYEFTLTVPAATAATAPASVRMKLTSGIVHKVEVVGDGGEHNLVKLVIDDGLHQAFPNNADGQFHPGFFPISYPEYYSLEEAPYELVARAWSPESTYAHEVVIRLGLERRDVLEPGREAISILGRLKSLIFGGG